MNSSATPTSTCPLPADDSRRQELCARLDALLPGPMAWLSLLFLVVTSGLIHRVGHGHTTLFEAEVIVWGLGLLWPIFIGEGLLRLIVRRTSQPWWAQLGPFLLICLAPPVRLGARSYSDPRRLWLPFLGMQEVGKPLRERLERFFSMPMIGFALMVLPLLALEFIWAERLRTNMALALFLDIGTSLIWTAFSIEFITMVAVCDNKIRYSFRNWTDLAVVILPVIDFLPFLRVLRLSRLLQLRQLTHLNRVYRFRALIMKAWRSMLVLDVIERMMFRSLESRIKRLKDLYASKEEELQDLRREIEELESKLAQQTAARVAESEGCS